MGAARTSLLSAARSLSSLAESEASACLRASMSRQEPMGTRGSEPFVANNAADAVGKVITDLGADKDSVSVFVHTAAQTPSPLLQGLADVVKARSLKNVTTLHLHIEGPTPHLDPALNIQDKSFFIGANTRKAVAEGRSDYIPVFLHEVPLLFRRGLHPIDVALISVSPADSHGYHSLGVSVDVTRAALQCAKKIVAVVSPHVPRTFGDGQIHTSHIDAMIEDPTFKPHEAGERSVKDADDAIGRIIAEQLVEDGATLQAGIGAIPNSTLRYCKDHKNLGVHSEMVSDGVIDLIKSGVVNNSQKKFQAGRTVTSFAIGSSRLYEFMHDNTEIEMQEVSYTNDTHIIRQQPKMTAINSAIEVDITGQVVSDSIGTRLFSGFGGQLDFIRGASLCPDGKAIIALHSTTGNGSSRIVPFLAPGAGVVTTRAHVHWIVTEYGAVNLFGKSLRERAKALISVAHPQHRDMLAKAATERMLM